jgi:hypothetical protein
MTVGEGRIQIRSNAEIRLILVSSLIVDKSRTQVSSSGQLWRSLSRNKHQGKQHHPCYRNVQARIAGKDSATAGKHGGISPLRLAAIKTMYEKGSKR